MALEETVTTSWFERVKKSAAGMGAGLALVGSMTGFLFWNEGRTVQSARSLAEGAGLVVPVAASPRDAVHDGQLIHVSGMVTAPTPLVDPEFGLQAPGLVLQRNVEMYQWVEKQERQKEVATGGAETEVIRYNYQQEWAMAPVDHSRFREPQGHENPEMLATKAIFIARDARLGEFALDDAVLGQLGAGTAWPVPADQQDAVQAAVGAGMRASLVDGAIRLGRDPAAPQIGDYRIRYTLVPVERLSIIGRQTAEGIASYRTESGDSLLMVSTGDRDARDMFAGAASANSTTAWAFRLAGLGLMIGGFAAFLAPLSVIASVIPALGSIMAFGTRSIAIALGLTLGGLTIAAAWLAYRPLLATAILGAVAVAVIATLILGRRRAAAAKAV